MLAYLKSFGAGFVSTLTFHQGVIGLFYISGAIPRPPFNMAPTEPLGVPSVISLAFWGGVWGVVLWQFLKNAAGARYWLSALLVGALGPVLVAFFIVFPLKNLPFAAGWDPKYWIGGLIVNGAWGLGVGVLMRVLRRL